ncbi:AraC-like DNA-binding protein [Rhodopseudomonas julia]|uniref:AraC-like DNA-binding protein n=1 Tax=Rhodopseudomonas julia TaxID=200617 RepID=A0ABU0C4P9_9BRAD|nr:AraC family transcriptional regulator [Rhodopseudomonas julia]MDQ0325465.1 AraC-like DNA-binding protein [Rhodopseudomonas julia]
MPESLASLDALSTLIRRHCDGHRCQTPVPGLTLVRSDGLTLPTASIYEPLLCVIAGGAKRAMLGDKLFEYGEGNYLVVSVDLPVVGQICKASREEPYLALAIRLDPKLLAAMLLEMGNGEPETGLTPGLSVSLLTPELLDPIVRFTSLLDRPQDIRILAPLIEREIVYRLMRGPQGGTLRQIALSDSRLNQISRAIAWIKQRFDRPLKIEDAADIAGMSPSSFHRHFKAVTAMSPLQYQKQLRLQRARHMLLTQNADAGSVSFAVGYVSPSQFSREYARFFGAPPARDAARLRASALDAAQLTDPV